MKYKDALSEAEVHKINIKAAKEWIEKNKSNIKAKPNKTLLYSGRDFDLEHLCDKLPVGDRKTFMGTMMYKRIDAVIKSKTGAKFEFETINMVLKKLRSPEIIDRDRLDKGFSDANECYNELLKMPKLIPAKVVNDCWGRMSEIFAGNASGDINVMDGCADDYARIGKDKVFIEKEMAALMKSSSSLSDAGKKVLRDRIGKYGAEFDRRYTALMKQVMADKEVLKGKRK